VRLDGLPGLALVVGCALAAGIMFIFSVWAWPPRAHSLPVVRQRSRGHSGSRSPLAVYSLALGLSVGAVTLAVSGVVGLAVVFGFGAAGIPWLVLNRRANKERLAMRLLWPDVVDSLVSALRAGASLPAAIAGLRALEPRVVREAATHFEHQFRLSGNFDACLDTLKETWADPAADRILETLRLARHVGGSDVTMILRALGGYLRQESAIRQEVGARQGWIRTAAGIGVGAPWVVLALLSTRPEAATAYNSAPGLIVIFVGLGITVVAHRIMLAVGVLDEPRRWFA
jgi:tight adherence protein B